MSASRQKLGTLCVRQTATQPAGTEKRCNVAMQQDIVLQALCRLYSRIAYVPAVADDGGQLLS